MATSHLSLIIPVYNRPNEVEELLDSLTRQSETNFEVVIVEDGSKETCQHVIEAFKNKLDVSYFYIPNGGPGNAHEPGALLLGEALPVDEADGFVLVHRQDDGGELGGGVGGGKLQRARVLAHSSAPFRPGHGGIPSIRRTAIGSL